MSILIRGMKMPTDKMKNIIILPDGPVIQFSGYGNPKPLGTAVPVPPHGRLIDADAFKKYITVSFEEVAPELEGGYKWLAERITNDLLKDIDDAPTIIPAEEGE